MEQNGGSCAGERSGGGGGGRAAWGEGARGPRGSPGWGLPGPAPSPAGLRAAARPGSGPFPPPGRGPPPSPPTRSHAFGSGLGCGNRRPGLSSRSRSAVTVFPPREASRESSSPPGRGTERDPLPPSAQRGLPLHTRRPETNNKKRTSLAPVFPPPSSSCPPIQETPFRPPSRGCALHAHT